jgi:hypothetical protein
MTISQLKDDLAQVKSSTAVDSKYKRHESAAKTSCIWRGYKQAERALEDTIKGLEEKLEIETVVHSETKDFLQRKHQAREQ